METERVSLRNWKALQVVRTPRLRKFW